MTAVNYFHLRRLIFNCIKPMPITNSKPEIQLESKKGILRSEIRPIHADSLKNKAGVCYLLTYHWWKSILDRVFAFLLLAALSPLLILIAMVIRLDSLGNPLFRQERVGKYGHRFFIYKFRSMYVNHDDSKYKAFLSKFVHEDVDSVLDENGQDIYELVNDPRVTRFGRFLRKTNLDELPQLFNVLKGEMSFIGPRPYTPFSLDMHNNHHRKRLIAKPG
ncbi:sugar transferase, partial [Candidatus Pacearchaeota archaeon]|nr:sugar transferase [Candidatus Pacearchaeota archaeon]